MACCRQRAMLRQKSAMPLAARQHIATSTARQPAIACRTAPAIPAKTFIYQGVMPA